MSPIYFTITATRFYHGQRFLEPEMKVKLVKEPDNKADSEAIKVELPGVGIIGYVANSSHTVIGESMSAGRIYDKIEDEAVGTVLYNLSDGVICTLDV
ncbi:MAG: DNA-binding protein [Lachnospiraceae bacterium]|nr:DNA-binding protein [Lachnospiraceae bacterium]